MVFSTPKDCEGFNHLTRLEEVVEVDAVLLRTASGRVFDYSLTSIDDTSLEYGILELRERTSERLQQFNDQRLGEAQRSLLSCINWEEYIRDLSDTGVIILAAAVDRIKMLQIDDGPVTMDTRPLSWFYFKGVRPSWAGGSEYLIEAADGCYYVEVDHKLVPVKKALVEQMVKQELIEQEYEYRHKIDLYYG